MLRHHRHYLPPVVGTLASLAKAETQFVQTFQEIFTDYGEETTLEELAELESQSSDDWVRHLVGLALSALAR